MNPATAKSSSGISFWEDGRFFPTFDLLIVGGGLVGLSAALSAQRKHPKARIAVLERGVIPTGASTKNAGFGCYGSPTELLDDLSHMEEEQVWQLVARRWEGLNLLRKEVGDEKLGLKPYGGYEVFLDEDQASFERAMERLPDFNERFFQITGHREAMKLVHPPWGTREMNVSGLIALRLEVQLNPASMMGALYRKCREAGISIFNGVQVDGFQPAGECWEVETQPVLPFRGRRILVATNGFTRQLLPDLELTPARNQVLITEPLPGLFSWKGCFHYHKGYVYFRNVGDRILLGGFRDQDPEAERTAVFGLSDAIREVQEKWLKTYLLPGHPVKITHRWSGILGVGPAKEPILRMVEPGLAVAVRLGGMGVALGNLLGKEAVDLIFP